MEDLMRLTPLITETIERDGLPIKSGEINLGKLDLRLEIAHFYLSWISECNEVIANLNLTLADLRALPERLHILGGLPWSRYKLLVRTFFHEFYRLREIFNTALSISVKRGFMTKSEQQVARNAFHDVIQEAVDSSANMLKLTLPHKVELRVPVWSKGTPEQFLVHVQSALDAIRQKGLQSALEKAIKDKEELTTKLTTAIEAYDNYKGREENPPKKKDVAKATEAVAREKETIESLIAQVFQLYSNLLTEEARRPWCKILGEQIDVTPWIDLYGVEHASKRQRSWKSFMECVTFHLLSVFRSDAAETQRFYISNGLKKPNRVPIRQFVQRVQQLNGYLHLLPCLFYSERATKLTKEVEPFDDADLASHILRMVPKHWQDQYELTGGTVPQSVRKLLEALERIEKAFPTEGTRRA